MSGFSEAYLLPVIKAMLEGFRFTISGFHADNGSEYINHQVAGLLEKLRIACSAGPTRTGALASRHRIPTQSSPVSPATPPRSAK